MNPLSLLLAFAPTLFGPLLSGADPRRELAKKLAALYGPQNIARTTDLLYKQFLSSPAFSAAQGQIANAGNTLSNTVGQNLGATGLRGSGVGAILPGLASTFTGTSMANLNSTGYQDAI